jgi:molybdopterin converting factor small subunit
MHYIMVVFWVISHTVSAEILYGIMTPVLSCLNERGLHLMITIQVYFFSTIRALIGKKTLVVNIPPGSTVLDLKLEIGRLFPNSEQALLTMLTSVNKVFSSDDAVLENNAEVAFFPFVSGG